jgi:L-ascorbate metabolism protein UlaG (beta-lactamase superfamily)
MSRLTFIGHATLLIELDGVRILTDPLLRERLAHIRRRVPLPALEQLRPLDAVLISHAHADHLDLASLRRVAGGATVVLPSGCASLLRRVPARRVIELSPGQSCAVGPLRVEAVHAEHDGRRHPLAGASPALGFVISGTTRVYFAGDTDLFDDMARLAGRVDVACLPVAGWGPRLPAGHLDPAGAARAVGLIRPRVAVPIHWGTMRSIGARHGPDPEAPAREFADAVAALGLPVTTTTLRPGESMALDAGVRAPAPVASTPPCEQAHSAGACSGQRRAPRRQR